MLEILTTRQAADYLKLAVSTIEKLRCHGGGPKFIKLGSRRVAYLKPDLEDWIAARPRCDSTSELTARPPRKAHRGKQGTREGRETK
jgi:predicted DNA-binding transcriptional regulator AlpA